MDIAFSVDSVLAAFGVSNKAWVIFLGGVMGVFMMRSVAKLFVKLLENVKELEVTAYLLIGVIGLKMMLTIFGIHINQIIFFSVIVALFGGTFVVHHFNKRRQSTKLLKDDPSTVVLRVVQFKGDRYEVCVLDSALV